MVNMSQIYTKDERPEFMIELVIDMSLYFSPELLIDEIR